MTFEPKDHIFAFTFAVAYPGSSRRRCRRKLTDAPEFVGGLPPLRSHRRQLHPEAQGDTVSDAQWLCDLRSPVCFNDLDYCCYGIKFYQFLQLLLFFSEAVLVFLAAMRVCPKEKRVL